MSLFKDLYILNHSLAIFSIHYNRDYPSYYNEDMFDINHFQSATLSSCIKHCADYTVGNLQDSGAVCTGVAYVNGICWIKNGIGEDSASYPNNKAVSAIMHLLNMAPIV